MQLDVSFQNWKVLTSLLRDEDDSYDAVIKRLLEQSTSTDPIEASRALLSLEPTSNPDSGAYFKDVFLPNGTEMRATYKGETYFAKILDSKWLDCGSGQSRTSPSQAAYSITGRNVNGWLFWLVKRPDDREWRSLNALRVIRP